MNDVTALVASLQALLSMVSLEFLKQLLYKLFPTFSVDPKWYTVVLPVLSFLLLPVASYLAGGPLDFSAWTHDALRQTLILVLTTVGAMFGYNTVVKPFKNATGLK